MERTSLYLAAAALAACGAVLWFCFSGTEIPRGVVIIQKSDTAHSAAPTLEEPPLANPVSQIIIDQPPQASLAQAPPIPARQSETPMSELEAGYRLARTPDEKEEFAREIAGRNNSEAVMAIARLFRAERHPREKMLLLSSLGDVGVEEGVDARVQLLSEALHHQPRDIRSTALDLLSQLDDPRAAALIRQAGATDPDKEIRDVAAALVDAQAGDDIR